MLIGHSIDVMPLMLAIKRRPELWKEDTYLRDYPQGKDVESIILRFMSKSGHEAEDELKNPLSLFDQYESIDYPPYAKLPEARSIVMFLMAQVGGERLGRVMVNKIRPGGRIYPHVDMPAQTDYYSRFHVVLQSAPGVDFRAGDEHVYMGVGEAWWFNNAQEHQVINNSGVDRIHMICDVRTSTK